MAGNGVIQGVFDITIKGTKTADEQMQMLFNRLIETKQEAKKLQDELNKIFDGSSQNEAKKRLSELQEQERQLDILYKERANFQANALKQQMADAKKAAIENESLAKQQALQEESHVKQVNLQKESAHKQEMLRIQAKTAELKKQAADFVRERQKLSLDRANTRAGNNNAPEGTYNAISKEYRDLLANIKNTTILGDPAQFAAATEQLYALKSQLDAFNRSLTADKSLVGEYTTGVVQAFKKMGLGSLVQEQVNTSKASLETLNVEFEKLVTELNLVRTTGVGSLDAVQREMIANRQAAMELSSSVERIENDLRGMGGIGSQITQALSHEFKGLKENMMGFIVGYMGFNAVISGVHEAIDVNRELSDTIGNIQMRLHVSREEAQGLVEDLKKLDTRTSLGALTDIASIVAKKGVAKEEIVGITAAVDNLIVTLGKEIGDPHEAVASLVKLVSVYSEDKHVTAKNITEIGSAIAKLTNSGVATGQFLIDFAERMGGIRGITGMTIDKVLGLGAALEELGQHSEVSGTALSQMVVKMFTDVDKYAKVAGMSTKEFSDLLKNDVLKAFVLVAEKLKGNAGEMEQFFEGIEDMHLKGGRAIGVLGDIAANADKAREKMHLATAAMHNSGIVADMAATKQQTFAATIDKIKKEFELAFTSPTIQAGMKMTAEAILGLIKSLPVLLTLAASLAAIWLVLNIRTIAYNATMAITNGITKAATAVNMVFAGSMQLVSGATNAATVAMRLFGEAWELSPIGAIASVLAVVAAAFTGLYFAIFKNTTALSDYSRQLKINQEIENSVRSSTAESISKIKMLTSVINDHNVSLDNRNRALKELQDMQPNYLKGLTLENVAMAEGKQLIDEYVESLKKKAAYEAASNLQKAAISKQVGLENMIYNLEKKRKSGEEMTDEERQASGTTGWSMAGKQGPDYAIMVLKKKLIDAKKEVDDLDNIVKSKYTAMGIKVSGNPGDNDVTAPGGDETVGGLEQQITRVKKQLKASVEGSKEAIALADELKSLQARLKAALGKQKFGHGSKLTSAEYEETKLIDSARDEELTKLKTAYMEQIAANKVYNNRMIDNERTYLEEQQRIEEEAIAKKAAMITGNKPAEQQARSRYKLQLLESQQGYASKFFNMSVNDLKAEKERKDSALSNDGTAAGELNYLNGIKSHYMDFMTQMNELEKQYNQQSAKNTEDRNKILVDMEKKIGKTVQEVQQENIDKEYSDLKKQYEGELRDLLKDRIKEVQAVVTSSMTQEEKKRALENINAKYDIANINADETDVNRQADLNAHLSKTGQITKDQFNSKQDELNGRILNNAVSKNSIEDEAAKQQKKIADLKKEGIDKIFDIEQTVVNETLAMWAKQDEVAARRAEKALNRNKELVNMTAASHREQMANEKAFNIAQEQLERDKAEKAKRRALAQMALEYAASALKIFASLAPGLPYTAAQLAIEEGALTAMFATKYAIASATPAYEQGGVPVGGGVFGGNRHSSGGTKFAYGGVIGEAEQGELAIINRRSAMDNGYYNISGSVNQIASALNSIGGGKNWAGGAQMYRSAYPGTMGSGMMPPNIAALRMADKMPGATDNNQLFAMMATTSNQVSALTSHIQNIQTHVSSREIAGALKTNVSSNRKVR